MKSNNFLNKLNSLKYLLPENIQIHVRDQNITIERKIFKIQKVKILKCLLGYKIKHTKNNDIITSKIFFFSFKINERNYQ